MRYLLTALDPRSFVREDDLRPTAILLASAILLALHRILGWKDSGLQSGSGLEESAFMFASAFVLLGIIPFIIGKVVFRESFEGLGICLGNWRLGVKMIAVLFPLIVLLMLFPASRTPEMTAFYPFAAEAKSSLEGFLLLEIPRGIFFYTAWEFFFRGFMLFGLKNHVGPWLAICIQTVPQCLWHIGMPNGEILSSIAGGLLFGLMALRTGSIVWPLLLHYLIGVGLDVLIIVRN